jgi:hypothetical protein
LGRLFAGLLFWGAPMVAATDQSPSIQLWEVSRGGIVNNGRVAIEIAELVTANMYGDDELKRQLPLEATEQDDCWVISGTHNKDRSHDGPGPVRVVIRKRDAQILDLVVPYVMHLPPEAKEILKKKAPEPE